MARSRRRWGSYFPKVSVAERRVKNERRLRELIAEGLEPQPVAPPAHKILLTKSFWGRGWCEHLERFSDYSNRLPRGRSYLRTGAVLDLRIAEGHVRALVNGTRLYTVNLKIKTLSKVRQKTIRKACTGQVKSLLALLQGQLSDEVMAVVMDPQQGLLPQGREISFNCTCPDWAVMCKHVAAVLFGIGVRLDTEPELLFLLRGMDTEDLVSGELDFGDADGDEDDGSGLEDGDLEGIFGIELAGLPQEAPVDEEEEVPADSGEFDYSGPAIAALRGEFGYSREEFAHILEVSAATILRWEKCPGVAGMRALYRRRLRLLWGIRCELVDGKQDNPGNL